PLTVLRTLIACWGDDAEVWQGRQVELYGDPSIRFGKDAVGGIRIKALSHLDEPKTVTVTVERGKRQKLTIQPLQQQPVTDRQALIQQAGNNQDALRDLWQQATQQQAPQHVFDTIQQAAQQQQKENKHDKRRTYNPHNLRDDHPAIWDDHDRSNSPI